MSEQKVEQAWETPTHDQIVAITMGHVAALEASDDDNVWVLAGMHHVVLHTVGRRSGNVHKTPLPTWRDPEGVRVVVASFAGHERHPAWYLNLADRAANPDILCRVQGGTFRSVPDIVAGGDEHARLWALLTADRAWYNAYQARTSRTIPLVRLPETHPA